MFFRLLCHACYVCELCALLGMVTLSPHIPCVELAGPKAKVPHPTGSHMCAAHPPAWTARHRALASPWEPCSALCSFYWPFGFCQWSPLHVSSYSLSFPNCKVILFFDATVCGRLVCVCVCVLHFISLRAAWEKKSQDCLSDTCKHYFWTKETWN